MSTDKDIQAAPDDEQHEDAWLSKLGDSRMKSAGVLVSHEDAWFDRE